jgi:hypothetical protein
MASGGVHLLSGFAIGALCPSPPSAFAAGVVSHAVFDAAPHREYETWTANMIDTGAAVTLAALLAARLPRGGRSRALVGAIGAVLPDAENIAYRAGLLPVERKVFPTHTGWIPHGRGGAAWTAGLSAVSVAAAFLAVRHVRRRATAIGA